MTCEPRELTIATVPERFATLGDLHAGIDDAAFSLEPLLEWAQRDERNDLADPGVPGAGPTNSGTAPLDAAGGG